MAKIGRGVLGCVIEGIWVEMGSKGLKILAFGYQEKLGGEGYSSSTYAFALFGN